MPNRKFDNLDRQKTLGDQKYRIIDMIENPFVVPDVAWDAEPVRYFKLNLQWCKILAGWLEWMEDVAGWSDADDELHAGIQGFLFFERGIEGGIFMDPDELKTAIAEGLYLAGNRLAAQIVSGRYTDIAVDEDGNVSQPSAGGDSDVPDDPATIQDESLESRNGSAINLALKINQFYSRISGLYGVDAVADRPVEQAIEWIENVYMRGESSTAVTDAMNEYWTRRAAGQPVLSFLTDLDQWLYCEGMTFEAVRELIYLQVTNVDAADNGSDLLGALDSDWFNLWIAEGSILPSTAYLGYTCTKIAPEQVQLNMASAEIPSVNTSGIWKNGHRYRVKASGTFTDSDNPGIVKDAFWSHDTTTGAKTFEGAAVIGTSGVANLTATLCPFQASHVYNVIVEKTGGSHVGNFSRNNNPFNLPNTAGILTFDITDEGEYLA